VFRPAKPVPSASEVTVSRPAPTLANSGGLTCYLDDGYLKVLQHANRKHDIMISNFETYFGKVRSNWPIASWSS